MAQQESESGVIRTVGNVAIPSWVKQQYLRYYVVVVVVPVVPQIIIET